MQTSAACTLPCVAKREGKCIRPRNEKTECIANDYRDTYRRKGQRRARYVDSSYALSGFFRGTLRVRLLSARYNTWGVCVAESALPHMDSERIAVASQQTWNRTGIVTDDVIDGPLSCWLYIVDMVCIIPGIFKLSHPPPYMRMEIPTPYSSPPSICEQCQSWQLLARPTGVDIQVLRNLRIGYQIHMSKPTVLVRMSGHDRKIFATFRELEERCLPLRPSIYAEMYISQVTTSNASYRNPWPTSEGYSTSSTPIRRVLYFQAKIP